MNAVREIIARQAGIPVSELRDDQTLESLDFDMLDRIEMIMDIEDALKIEISDADVDAMSEDDAMTVGQFLAHAVAKGGAA